MNVVLGPPTDITDQLTAYAFAAEHRYDDTDGLLPPGAGRYTTMHVMWGLARAADSGVPFTAYWRRHWQRVINPPRVSKADA